jgi:hypothetical protein
VRGALGVLFAAALVAACGGAVSRGHPGAAQRLVLNQSPAEVAASLGATACKVETQFHGNPAEAWGYKVVGTAPARGTPRLRSSACDAADFWVYFEKQRLVGWTH